MTENNEKRNLRKQRKRRVSGSVAEDLTPAFQPLKDPPSHPQLQRVTILNNKDHYILYSHLHIHAAYWGEIGVYLGFFTGELKNIHAQENLYNEGVEGFLREMLSRWLQWAPGDDRGSKYYATLEALKKAVDRAGRGKTAINLSRVDLTSTQSNVGGGTASSRQQCHNELLTCVESAAQSQQSTESDIVLRLLNEQHHSELFWHLSKHAVKWIEIGICLGFFQHEIDIIKAGRYFIPDVKGFLCKMLSDWYEWAPGDARNSKEFATLKALNRAVSSAGLGICFQMVVEVQR